MLSRVGHRVVATSTGDGAAALVSEWPVDLMIVDQGLQGTTGVEVAEQLRRDNPQVPILILAEQRSGALVAAARVAGADGCIIKPLELGDLDPWLEAQPEALAATPAE